MPMMKLAIIVPCRLESTRFRRKLLHPIRGQPLLRWVAERIANQVPELPLFFAVDDERLCAPLAGFQVIMTSPAHPSGTDRLAEANRTVQAERVINIQADEPLVTGAQIRALVQLIAGDAPMATLATPFKRAADFTNPNQVKVAFGRDGRALFFSRSPLPFAREHGGAVDDAWVVANPCFKHLGLYAYHSQLLEKFPSLPPGRYEQIEKLEQLRVLEAGYDMRVGLTDDPSIGVDTLEDAVKFEQSLGKREAMKPEKRK
ncbi:MAG TPA: 3-deoxy-manno-octulosonate cytidylyltransferase [Opitutaceae bacterium]|jgi:3-deoxy-manno-octulosonate cytidylyltransferase (CMP-KDO synthetase)|nr:3-deoxy-manno-octulosonate cytidylyltransferase [Opitutaceae bacterium]